MELWPHQERIVEFAAARPYSLVYAGMGSGKTLAALTYLSKFAGLRVALTPKPVMGAWRDDHQRFELPVPLLVLDRGTSKQKQARMAAFGCGVVVVNYETAARIDWGQFAISAAVADEVHKLGQYNGRYSMALARAFADTPHKMAMTGTPYTDSRLKLYGICRWLDCEPFTPPKHPQARQFGHYNDFLDQFTTYRQDGYVKIVTGYRNSGVLASTIAPFTVKIRTEDVVNLPAVVNRDYLVPMEPGLKRVYRSLEIEHAVRLEGGEGIAAPHILSRIVRLQQLADSGQLVGESGEVVQQFDLAGRRRLLRELLEQTGDRPVVIFTRFKRDVELVAGEVGEPVGYLTGDRDTHEEWQRGATRVLVANIAAGGVGVRLERADTIIFWSIGWSAGDYQQAIGRIRRAGQKAGTVYLYNILTEGSVDSEIMQAITAKLADEQALDRRIENESH